MERRGGIITNLDSRLTPQEVAEGDAKERRQEFIDRKFKAAEKAEIEGGDVPDTIYTSMQEQGKFTANPELDSDPEWVRLQYVNRRPLPIKERQIEPDGTEAIVVTDQVAKAIGQGWWCHKCTNPQPQTDIEWMAQANRLEERLGPKPIWAAHGTMCPYCGAKLGYEGRDDMDNMALTPEQQMLLEKMFGPMVPNR